MADSPRHTVRAGFETTHWSIVLLAGSGRGDQAARALSSLCETYWYPVYAFVRRQGYAADESRDLTQEFFLRVLDKNYFGDVDPARGRFRSFLITAVRHFLSNQQRHRRARKRGGGRQPIALDFDTAEGRYQAEGSHDLTPEKLFDRRWALLVLDRAMSRVRDKYVASGRLSLFEHLQPFLTGAVPGYQYADVAGGLGMSDGAVKVAAHRLRRQFRDELIAEIAATVSDAREVDAEIRYLIDAVSS